MPLNSQVLQHLLATPELHNATVLLYMWELMRAGVWRGVCYQEGAGERALHLLSDRVLQQVRTQHRACSSTHVAPNLFL